MIYFTLLTLLSWEALGNLVLAQDSPPDLSAPSNANQSVFGLSGFDTNRIADGLYTFRWEGTRNIFLVTPDGVIATDPISINAAKALKSEIAKITDLPVKYVVYSHNHWDHVLGGSVFTKDGAEIVAHENCVKHFKDLPHTDLAMPDITFSGNYDLELGGRRLELIYLGPNHGDCLVVMRPHPEPILFVVDLVTPFGVPLGRMNDYSLHHWVRSLREIEAMQEIEAIIPGHRMPIAPMSALTERRAYLEALILAVRAELAAGTPVNVIPEKIHLPAFTHMRNYDSQIKENARRVITYYNMGW